MFPSRRLATAAAGGRQQLLAGSIPRFPIHQPPTTPTEPGDKKTYLLLKQLVENLDFGLFLLIVVIVLLDYLIYKLGKSNYLSNSGCGESFQIVCAQSRKEMN